MEKNGISDADYIRGKLDNKQEVLVQKVDNGAVMTAYDYASMLQMIRSSAQSQTVMLFNANGRMKTVRSGTIRLTSTPLSVLTISSAAARGLIRLMVVGYKSKKGPA